MFPNFHGSFLQEVPLSQFASTVLQDICGQIWLREQCLRHSDLVCSKEILLDPALSPAEVSDWEIRLASSSIDLALCYRRRCSWQSFDVTTVSEKSVLF